MLETRTTMGAGGRVVIPSSYRRSMGIRPGDEVIIVLERGELRILTPRQAVARAQAMVRSQIPVGKMLSVELIRDRRRETRLASGRA